MSPVVLSLPSRIRGVPLAAFFAVAAFSILPSLRGAEPATPPSAEAQEQPLVRPAPGVRKIPLKRPKNAIGSLLFVRTDAGTFGKFTTISGVAQPLKAGEPGELAFDRFLGPLTMKGLDSVLKAVQSLHGGWPAGNRIVLSFSDKVAPVELGPANLPAALLIDSMIRDWDIDPGYAVVGTLQPDGSIDAAGAIAGRLDGATHARITRMAIPEKNQTEVADYLLSAGVTSFVGTQIFTVKHYNDAGRLALTKLDPQTASAVELFGSVQRTLGALSPARATELLRDPRVLGTLQKVVETAPTHLSARILYDWGSGQRTQMSLTGSMDAIERLAPGVLRGGSGSNSEALKQPREQVTQEVARLRVVRDRVDARARPYAEAVLRFGEAVQKAQAPGGGKAAQAALDPAREAVNAEWTNVVKLKQEAAAK